MRATILIILFSASIFAVEKSNDDNNLKILQKQIEHQLSVKADAAGATKKCLAELKNKKINEKQKQIFQQLLIRSAIQSKDLSIARKAEAYLTSHNIACDKLKQRLSLGLPENLNLNLNKNIREALEYQWNNLNWQTGKEDHDVFDGYLKELTENTNVTETTRAQTALLRTIICVWIDFADFIELDFITVEKQYKRLLIDLQCPKDKEKLIEVKRALDRYYETAREYMDQKHPYLAIAAIINLSFYAKEISKEEGLKDISRVQINRLYKQANVFFRNELRHSKFEKQIPLIFTITKDNTQYRHPYKFSLYLAKPQSTSSRKKPNLIKLYSRPPFVFNWRTYNPKPKERPTNINSITNLMCYDYAKFVTDIVFPEEKLNWKQGEDKNIKIGDYNVLVKRDWVYITTTGKWNQVVWNERFSKLKNDILKLESPLNEIRKYVYENYEKQLIENQQKTVVNQKEKEAFKKELKIFIEEGPMKNEKAMKARDNLLKMLSASPDLTKTEFVDVLKKYPEITDNSISILWKITRNKNSQQWQAIKFYNEIQEFQKTISTMKNPELIMQFSDSFFNKLEETGIDTFLTGNFPVFRAIYYYIERSANRNLTVTNFYPLLANELERIADGYSLLDNYINFLNVWMPVAVKAEQWGLKHALYTMIKVEDYKFDWQAKARMKLAKNQISSYNKLPKRERIRKTVETFVELERGLRKDAGLSTNTVDWVKKLGLDKPDVGEIYRVKEAVFPKRPIEFINAAEETLSFRIKGMSQFKKVGDIIKFQKKDLYKIKKYTPKTTNIFIKLLNSTKSKNISTVELEDLQTGEKFTLAIGKGGTLKKPEAILQRISDNKNVLVKKGDKVPLNDKFSTEIANINVQNQTVTFVLGNETNILKAVQKKAKPVPEKREKKVILDFNNVPVLQVLDYLSELTGDIILHRSSITNRKITIIYQKPVTPKEAEAIIFKIFGYEGISVSAERNRDGRKILMVN